MTKELCGHSRARKTDFDLSLVNFIQLIRYISDLAGKTYDCIYSVAVSGHLLHVTAPENFVKGPFNVSEFVHYVEEVTLLFCRKSLFLLDQVPCLVCFFLRQSHLI